MAERRQRLWSPAAVAALAGPVPPPCREPGIDVIVLGRAEGPLKEAVAAARRPNIAWST